MAFAAAVVTILVGTTSHAGVIVADQANLPPFTTLSAAGFGGQTNERGQTFTVGIGGRLDSISVAIARLNAGQTNDVVFRIFDTVGAIPATERAAITLSATTFSVGGGVLDPFVFVNIPLASFNISVAPGDVLAFAAVTSGSGFFSMQGGANSSPYASGNRIFRSLPSGSFQVNTFGPTVDFAFQTFVDTDPATVPEPSTLALAGVGLLSLGLHRKRVGLLYS